LCYKHPSRAGGLLRDPRLAPASMFGLFAYEGTWSGRAFRLDMAFILC